MKDNREDAQAADVYGGVPYVCRGRDRCCVGEAEASARQGWGLAASVAGAGGAHGGSKAVELGSGWWNGRGASTRNGIGSSWSRSPLVDVSGGTGSWLVEWPRHEHTRWSHEVRDVGRRAPPPGRTMSEQ